MLETWMKQASSYAQDVDNLVWLILVLVGFWFIVAEVVFFWLIFKFREREGRKGQKWKYLAGHVFIVHRCQMPNVILRHVAQGFYKVRRC